MISNVLFLVVILVVGPFPGLNARSITRSGSSGNVNLVEVNVQGKTYGKCSYINAGQEIMVMFEEADGEFQAKAANPTILDPISEARQCREAAAKPLTSDSSFRADLGSQEQEESPDSLELRLADLQEKLVSNQDYVSELLPRILLPIPFPIKTSGTNNLLFTLANPSTQPQFTFNLPTKTIASSAIGIALPFKTGFFGR